MKVGRDTFGRSTVVRCALAAALVAFGSCASAPRDAGSAPALPTDWRERDAVAMAEWIEEHLPRGAHVRFDARVLDELALALDHSPRTATVAAVLLGRSGDERAHAALLARLERRVAGPARVDDAGDCAAAMALGAARLAPRDVERLVALAADADRAHPDFEVRVECALAALAHGRDDGVPFLLAVVRHGTPEATARGERITDSQTTAWPRWRAASGLERAFGLPRRYDSDAPPAVRAEIARELEAAHRARAAVRG